jgi:hypothetical protein
MECGGNRLRFRIRTPVGVRNPNTKAEAVASALHTRPRSDLAIFVRFVITRVETDTYRFEQAFSADGGRTWEVNWVATDTRIR